ncbi:hypothetical protein ACFYO0_09970 [Streptomyces sp. NPDC006365]|uniref:hypothetical protein n=1 Tax=Streptomyces sp. NPDC006365 TaxID=3364744 RepID=UPI0036C655AE
MADTELVVDLRGRLIETLNDFWAGEYEATASHKPIPANGHRARRPPATDHAPDQPEHPTARPHQPRDLRNQDEQSSVLHGIGDAAHEE